MKNIISFLRNKNKCSHKNALLFSDNGYCPDCGKYLEKKYYIVRCTCCNIKRPAKIFWGEIVPVEHFCTNCGNSEYYIEQVDNINFIDAKYAVYLKEIVPEINISSSNTQVWVEENKEVKKISMQN